MGGYNKLFIGARMVGFLSEYITFYFERILCKVVYVLRIVKVDYLTHLSHRDIILCILNRLIYTNKKFENYGKFIHIILMLP